MKRTLSLILAALTAAAALASCGGAKTETPADGTSAAAQTETTEPVATETSREDIPDNLPDKDYDGYTYVIMCGMDDVYYSFLYAEEENGSPMNDAVYAANVAVQERFNVKMGTYPVDKWTNMTPARQAIAAGDECFAIAYMQDINSAAMTLEGLTVNLYDLPHVDVSQPWWPAYTTESMTLNGKMYLVSNASTWFGFWGTRTVFFNTKLVEDNKLDNPYQLVREDKWTLDKLISMTKDFYKDVNGDGSRDYGDVYGFAMTVPYALYENFGFEAYRKVDNNTRIELDVNNEATVNLLNKLSDWLISGQPGTVYSGTHSGRYNEDSSNTWFANGTVLYTYGAIGHLLRGLVNTDTMYGILPMPKTTPEQKDYICASNDLPGWVPVLCSDKERTGIILEAMSAEGYKKVNPMYYEYALKGRYAQDAESTEMIDLMFKNRVLSFSYMYGGSGKGFQHIVNNVLNNGGNFASYYEENRAFNEERVRLVNEFYGKTE